MEKVQQIQRILDYEILGGLMGNIYIHIYIYLHFTLSFTFFFINTYVERQGKVTETKPAGRAECGTHHTRRDCAVPRRETTLAVA